MTARRRKTTHDGPLGVWLIGAGGNVAATVAVGLDALRRGTEPIGLTTALPAFEPLNLRPPGDIVLGGHEVRDVTPIDTAEALRRDSGLFDEEMLRAARPQLQALARRIRFGTWAGTSPALVRIARAGGKPQDAAGPARASSRRQKTGRASADESRSRTVVRSSARSNARPAVSSTKNCSYPVESTPRETIGRLRRDLREFRERERLSRVVMVNVASTEPPVHEQRLPHEWNALDDLLTRSGPSPLPASCLYAIAALEEGVPYVNFTPSLGVEPRAIRQLADMMNVPIMGRDGKTGETLLKTVIGPMFRERNLRVLSWDGHNVLGNLDGLVLSDPHTKPAKLSTKSNVLAGILGYEPPTRVSIEYVESMGDWKTAWDHVHFRGFLGTKMTLQFTWQGCDSILAAPLVIDLARLADHHAARGLGGVMRHLSCFFKSPMDVAEQDFRVQADMLRRYIEEAPGRHAIRAW